jgi:hypothetical protein
MPFDAVILYWPTVDAFAAHLATVPRPVWATEPPTNHNTYKPNEYEWLGMASMLSMMKVYVDKGWSAGPHLYLAAEAPNPADRGIWQMTPLAHVGVHAGPCNSHRHGIENVGDFQARRPSPAQYDLLLDVNEVILRHWRMAAGGVVVHNECMPGRTCPGQYLVADKLRVDLIARLSGPPPPLAAHYTVLYDGCRVREGPGTSYPVAIFGPGGPQVLLPRGFSFVSDGVKVGTSINGNTRWVHIAQPAPWGWISDTLVERV